MASGAYCLTAWVAALPLVAILAVDRKGTSSTFQLALTFIVEVVSEVAGEVRTAERTSSYHDFLALHEVLAPRREMINTLAELASELDLAEHEL